MGEMGFERPRIPQTEDGSFLPDDEPPVIGDFWNLPISRRSFFGRAAGVLAAFHVADTAIAESSRWNRNNPELVAVETEHTPEKFRDHMTVLLPGLGVPGSSAANMTYAVKPVLENYGQLAYIRYADDGLTSANFQKTADAMQAMLIGKGIRHASFICHSAGGPNLARLLRAPVERWGFMGAGVGQPVVMEEAWEYWQRVAGVSIDHVTYVSSPPNGSYIKGVVQQNVARMVAAMPESALRAGASEKLIGNLLINHSIDYTHFASELDRIHAALHGAEDDYSATDWLTQLRVIQSMGPTDYQGTLAPGTGISVIRPTNPNNDEVVITSDLPAGWATMFGRPAASVGVVEDPRIGHADIFERKDIFNDLFAGIYGTLYPSSPADVRLSDKQ